MKTFRTTGTGSEQTISEIESDKIPLYPSEQDLLDDLANLEVGQIAGTVDPAESELIGLIMQQMNNNVLLSALEDITISTDSSNPTVMQYDGFIIANGNGHAQRAISMWLNGKEIWVADGYSGQADEKSTTTIPVVKGDELYWTFSSTTLPADYYAYGRFYKVRDYSSR